MKKVLIVRSNPCNSDPRVAKIASTLSEHYKVTILCWDREVSSPRKETVQGINFIRFHQSAEYGQISLILKLPLWFMFVAWHILFNRYEAIHACDFDTYFPAILPAKIKRAHIVYDIFDFYADMISLPKAITKPLAKLDKWMIKFADAVVLVDRNRLHQIQPSKPKRTEYIYNIPDIDPSLLKGYKLTEIENNYFFYCGILSSDRYIQELLNFFIKNPKLNVEIGGWGPLEGLVIDHAKKTNNITFLGKINYKTVIEKTAKCRIMIAFYNPNIPNNKLASPNKLFEALALQKPLLTNHGTTLSKFVEENKIGLVVNPENPTEILEAIEKLDIQAIKKTELDLYETKYNWNYMKLKLSNLYKELFAH